MKNLIVIMNNSVSIVSGQNSNKCSNKFFSGGPEEKEIRVGRAWQLAAAGAAANCDASNLRQALRDRSRPANGPAGGSAGGFSRIRCSIPWCTRSDSGAGGGRLPDAAQEVAFPVPASRASNNSAGASERSACQPRQRVAKCDAASIGCSIPLNQEDDLKRPGGNSSGPYVYRFGCEALGKGNSMINDERKKENPDKRRFCFATDGVERLHNIIPDWQVGKGRGSAGDGRIKCGVPENPLRPLDFDRGNPLRVVCKRDSMAQLKSGRRGNGNPFEIVIKSSRRIDCMSVEVPEDDKSQSCVRAGGINRQIPIIINLTAVRRKRVNFNIIYAIKIYRIIRKNRPPLPSVKGLVGSGPSYGHESKILDWGGVSESGGM